MKEIPLYQIKRIYPKKEKEKKSIWIRSLTYILVACLMFLGFSVGWKLNDYFAKHILSEDDVYSPKDNFKIEEIKNTPENLSIHLCSTQCFYEFEMTKEEYKEKENDSFLINNQINNSNCGTCFKLKWNEE